MSNRKKILLAVPYFLWWILYFLLSAQSRNEYEMGKLRGMDCIGSRDCGMIAGSTTEFSYDPSSPPTRRYYTWKEWWSNRGY